MNNVSILERRLSELRSLAPCPRRPAPIEQTRALLRPASPPRTQTEARLCALWKRVLSVDTVGPESNFFDLGGYSLNVVRLFSELNREFGTTLPFTVLFEAPTIERLAAAIEHEDRYGFRCTVPVRTTGSRKPLFVIQSYLIYEALSRALGDDQPFYGMLEPPVDRRQPPYRLEDLAKLYADAIEQVQPSGPYAIAGWCAAGIIALEVARQLEARGKIVGLLGLIDAWCPVRPASARPAQRGTPVLRRVSWKAKLTELLESGRGLCWRRLAALWLNRGRELPRLLRSASQLTLESIRRYRPRPVSCPIVVFRAEAKDFRPYEDEWCGWKPWTQSGVSLVPVPGDHLSMFHEPQLSITAMRIREQLPPVAALSPELCIR